MVGTPEQALDSKNGALYNWYTVKTGKLCPTGWHMPSDEEWKQLEMALGMTKEEADIWAGRRRPYLISQ